VFLGNTGSTLADQVLYGKLRANDKCVGAREMGLFRKTNNGYRLLDVDLSSFNGAWALRGNLTGQPDLAIKVNRDTRKRGNVICKADTLLLTSNSSQYPRAS
jgi:hypothetical protein